MTIVKTDLLQHRYRLILTQLNEVPIGEMTQVEELSYSPALADIGELNFVYPKYVELEGGEMFPTPLFSELEEDMLILIDDKEYYYIDSCVESDQGGIGEKRIHAYSRQYELSMKSFNDYDPETEKFLYFVHPDDGVGYPWFTIPSTDNLDNFLTESVARDGYPHGLFNMIEKYTSWKLKRDSSGLPIIPNSLKSEVRFIKTSESNILELLKQIQEAWNCLFVYNTLDRTIEIITMEDLIQTPNGVLSDETFILGLTKEFKKEEIKTRLYMYNMNGVGVLAERMAHGNTYIEDYSYFKNDRYMSTHLQSALDTYTTTLSTQEQAVIELWGSMRVLLHERKATEDKIDQINQNMQDPLFTYNHYVSVRDGFILNPGTPQEEVIAAPRALSPEEQASLEQASRRLSSLETQLNVQMTGNSTSYPRSLTVLDDLIEAKMSEIRAVQNISLMPDVFNSYEQLHGLETGSLMSEMEPYIRDATFTSETIQDARDLHSLGKDMIKRVSKPRMQFTMDLINFLDKVEFEHSRFLATLGQIIRIESTKLNFADNVILLRYTHNPDQNSLVFEFSNDLEIKNDETYLAELISKSNSVSSQVAFNANYWGAGGSTGGGFGPGGGSGGSVGTGGVFDNLFANVIQTNRLVANSIETTLLKADEIYAKTAEIGSLVAGSIEADSIITDKLSAIYATIEHLNANYIDANEINANYATIDLLNVGTGSFNEILTKTITANQGLITNLKIIDANVVSLDAGKISTGTLSVDRLVIRNPLDPSKSLIYAINNIDGALQSATVDTINGEVITNNTIHADKIIAESITAREIAAGSITADKIESLSITAAQIQGNTITANKMVTGTITAASGVISSIDANVITTGTLSANRVRAGLLKSTDNQTWIDLDTGYFNFKNRMKMDENGFALSLADNQTIEDYVAGQVGVTIQATPAHHTIPASEDGIVESQFSFKTDIAVQKGFERINAIISTPSLRDENGNKINNPGITFSLTNPTVATDGSITVNLTQGMVLPTNTGTVSFNVETTNPTKSYIYKVGWAKSTGGVGVVSITPEYARNTSKTTPPVETSSSWSQTPPTWIKNTYLWTRNSIIYSNSPTPVYTTPVVDSTWEAVNKLESDLTPMIDGKLSATQQAVFNALTVNGTKQGIFMDGSGNLWVNGYYISVASLDAITSNLGTIYSGNIRLNRGANNGRNYGHLNADKLTIGISDNPNPSEYESHNNYFSKLEIDSWGVSQTSNGTTSTQQFSISSMGFRAIHSLGGWNPARANYGLETLSGTDGARLYSIGSQLRIEAPAISFNNRPTVGGNALITLADTNSRYEGKSVSSFNNSGGYMRFDNGVLICWARFSVYMAISSAWGSLFYSPTQTWSFPASFASGSAPSVTASISNSAGEAWSLVTNVTTASASMYALRASSVGSGSYSFNVFAAGRWK